jgi:hypothetical protein
MVIDYQKSEKSLQRKISQRLRSLELDNITPGNVIKFLFTKMCQWSWNFFYNVTFNAEVILKLFGDGITQKAKISKIIKKKIKGLLRYLDAL